MFNTRNLLATAALSLCAFTSPLSLADDNTAGAQFSFFDFNAPDVKNVKGVRFVPIYGKTGTVTGVDFGLVAYSELENVNGVVFPLVIGANHISGDMKGVAFGVFGNHKGNDIGANLHLINLTNNVKGANVGAVNYSTGYTYFDWSIANFSKKSNVQLGIFNSTDEIKGVQIGLLNCAKNGFLRCFPFVNWAKSSK